LCGGACAAAVRVDRATRLPVAGAVARDPALRADAAQRRGCTDAKHHRAGLEVRTLRLPADYGAPAECRLVSGERSRAVHLAARRAESTRQAKTEGETVAGGRLVCTAEAGTGESCLELRLCQRHDPRGKDASHSDGVSITSKLFSRRATRSARHSRVYAAIDRVTPYQGRIADNPGVRRWYVKSQSNSSGSVHKLNYAHGEHLVGDTSFVERFTMLYR
jgi:hypothetical protein